MLVRGALRPGGSGREWCDVEVLRRIRRASVARLRREVEAVEQPALARFLPAWHGVGRKGRGGVDRLREVLFPLQRLPLAPEVWERQVLPLRMDYRPELLDQLCTSGEVVWLGADAGRVAIAFREDAALLGPPGGPGAAARRPRLRGGARGAGRRASPRRAVRRDRPARRARSSKRCGGSWPRARPRTTPGNRCGARAGQRLRGRSRRAPARAGSRAAARRCAARRSAAGLRPPRSWRRRSRRPTGDARSRSCCSSATACSCAQPSSPRAIPGGPAGLRRALGELETLGVSRRGYLVDGLGGAQHALPGAIERLREVRDPSTDARAIALAASDPANPYGIALRWPAHAAGRASRAAGALVVLRNGEPLAFLERGARTLLSLQPLEPGDWAAVAEALATASLEGPRGLAAARAHRRRGRDRDSDGRRVHGRRIRRRPEAPDAAREALALPEGHNLELAALRMAPLVGHRVAAHGPGYQAPHGLAEALDGRVLESVEARGKHLLAGFDNGRILHSHLRMTGAWHVYAEGQAWARSPRSAWLALTANATCAVQFGGPVLELLDRARVALHPALRSLGPDLLDEDPQIAVAVRRARERSSPARAIGEVLLDQTIAAGIGNVVRCEALYALRVDPWAPLGSVSDEDAERAVRAFPAHPAGGRALGRRPAADDLRAQGLPALRRRSCAAGDRATRRARCIGAPPASVCKAVNTI